MKPEPLKLEILQDVAIITLDHPPANALGESFLVGMEAFMDRLEVPGGARALVIRSAVPGFFSAGDDVSKLLDITDELIALLPRVHDLFNRLERLPMPTIASINGHALGGGLELAMACDLRYMAANSGNIGLPEVRLGMIPSFGGTQRLPALVGKARALELMIRGWMLDPEEARGMGLVNDVFLPDQLEEKVMDLAHRMSRQATGAIAKIKECVLAGTNQGPEKGMEAEIRAFGENIRTNNAREGIRAFLEHRKPRFG